MSDLEILSKSWKENEWLCVAESKATHGWITKATVSSSRIELVSAALNMCQLQEHPWMHHTDYNSSGGKKTSECREQTVGGGDTMFHTDEERDCVTVTDSLSHIYHCKLHI